MHTELDPLLLTGGRQETQQVSICVESFHSVCLWKYCITASCAYMICSILCFNKKASLCPKGVTGVKAYYLIVVLIVLWNLNFLWAPDSAAPNTALALTHGNIKIQGFSCCVMYTRALETICFVFALLCQHTIFNIHDMFWIVVWIHISVDRDESFRSKQT